MKNRLITTITLYLMVSLFTTSFASTITVDATDGAVADDGVCSISEAIIAANTDAVVSVATGECSAGNGTDTINITVNITLTALFDNYTPRGRTGTPAISSAILLDGMGFSLDREASLGCTLNEDVNPDEFRLIRIKSTGNLDLRNITLSHGCSDGMNSNGTINTFYSKTGAAIFNEGTLSMDNSIISENSAHSGGGIFNNGTISTIQNSTFSGNSAGNGRGGGIFNRYTITTIQNSTFSGNSADHNGGGIYNDLLMTTIQNSTFSGNSAIRGGGIYNDWIITTIQNSTFSGNSADNSGGGIYNDVFEASINKLRNSLFHQNTGEILACVFSFNGSGSGSNNLSDDATIDCPGVSTTLTTATVGPLTDNGGPTLTHALRFGSEALDAGNDSSTQEDQRGFAASGIRDIGAFEAHVPSIVAPIDFTVEATGALSSPPLGMPSVIDTDETGLIAIASPAIDFSLGVTTVTWTATDSQGFMDSDTQVVTIVDSTAPELTLEGATPVILTVGDSYTDAGATATDFVDDDTALTANIVVNNPVNTAIVGTYIITYDVSDNAGNPAIQITRTVNVLATVSGTVVGLAAGTTVEIQNNKGDNITINTDGAFTFATALALDADYNVTVLNQPTEPAQVCSVSNPNGEITSGNINNVLISCTTNQYLIGGMVSGLASGNTVSLDINPGDETLLVNTDGAFVFVNPLTDLTKYTITVDTQPSSPSQTCSVVNGVGQINANDVDDINVNCVDDTFFVGGNISGLQAGFSLLLKNNNADDMTINTSGSFVFATPLLDLNVYDVTMQILPENTARDCVISNKSGSIAGDDIDDVEINCDAQRDLIFKNDFE